MSVVDQGTRVASLPGSASFAVRLSPHFVNRLSDLLQKPGGSSAQVAGLLFGHTDANVVHVQVFKSFLRNEFEAVSRSDEGLDRLTDRLLMTSRNDPEVAGLDAVGWYELRATGGLHWEDVDFHNRYFHRPSDLALILRPETPPRFVLEFYSRSASAVL